jgi:DNA-binding response OmpR family regulator
VKKILIIDDDTYILKSFSSVLAKRGFEVDTVETGKQALEKLKQGSFDLALIDICLPDMEARTCLNTLKRN